MAAQPSKCTFANMVSGAVIFMLNLALLFVTLAQLLLSVPAHKRRFAEMLGDEPLPLLTRMVIAFSDFIRERSLLLSPLLILGIGLLALVMFWPKISWKIKVPIGLFPAVLQSVALVAIHLAMYMVTIAIRERMGM